MAIGFPGYTTAMRTIRMPVNPLDKTTIVSVFQKEIDEIKHTVFPGRFHIDAAPDGDISILVVGPSSWWKEMEDGQPMLEIPTSSVVIGESVVKDYCNGIIGCNMSDRMPGLFCVPGEHTEDDIRNKFQDKIIEAQTKQLNWFRELIRISDILWARTNGNPLSISNDARLAATKLGLNKSWMQDFRAFELSNCKACGELVNPKYPVCKHCKAIINTELAEELDIQFAK